MNFVPLAFRAGSEGKKRIHIFWERRVRVDDTETPYWYPCATNAGSLRADRVVLPIPPGKNWCDAMPILLPDVPVERPADAKPALPGKAVRVQTGARRRGKRVRPSMASHGLRFSVAAAPQAPLAATAGEGKTTRKKMAAGRLRFDPKHIAAARELRDRYLEEVNSGRLELSARGKYDVGRSMESATEDVRLVTAPLPPLLRAAA
jgi:hypothetical protein